MILLALNYFIIELNYPVMYAEHMDEPLLFQWTFT